MAWLQWVLDLIAKLSGGMTAEERATQDRRLGEAQAKIAADDTAQKDDQRAQQIDEDVSHLSHDGLVARLRKPDHPGGV